MKSECCDAKVFKARSHGGWWINGQIVHEFYECSQCKQPCDIISETHKKDQEHEQSV